MARIFKGALEVYIPHTHSQPFFLKTTFFRVFQEKAWKIYFLGYFYIGIYRGIYISIRADKYIRQIFSCIIAVLYLNYRCYIA